VSGGATPRQSARVDSDTRGGTRNRSSTVIGYLPGISNRLRAMQTWCWWHVTREASARVLIEDGAANER